MDRSNAAATAIGATDQYGLTSWWWRLVALTSTAALLLTSLVAVTPAEAQTDPGLDIAEVCPPVEPESDVSFGDTGVHGEAIDCFAQFGIVNGLDDGTFGTDDPLRRDQMASIIRRFLEVALGEAVPDAAVTFGDVDPDSVHADAIGALAAVSIVQGVDGTTYDPTGTVTRQQMASFIVRTLDYLDDGDVNGSFPPAGEPSFTDVVEGSTHADDIDALAALGVALGLGDGLFGPLEPVLRGQVVTFFARAAVVLLGEGSWAPGPGGDGSIVPDTDTDDPIDDGSGGGGGGGTTDPDPDPENTPPTIEAIVDQTATEGVAFGPLSISVSDSDGDDVTVTVDGLPDGLSFDDVDTIAGTPGADTAGDYTVTVTADDGVDEASITFAITVQPPAPADLAATVTINVNGGIGASSFSADSFAITNDGDADIESVSFDLSTSWIPNMVFDPVGEAGDVTAKCLEVASGGGDTGLSTDGSGSGDGSCVAPFSEGNAGDGYDVMTLEFDDFNPGESLTFAVDVDPTSIKGFDGAGNAGAISGLELAGSLVEISSANGNIARGTWSDGSDGGGIAVIDDVGLPAATLTTPGLSPSAQPDLSVDHFGAQVEDLNQTVQVAAPQGSTVELLVGTATIEDVPSDGREPYPFERNKLVGFAPQTATVGTDGFIEFDVTVPSNGDALYLVAAVVDAEGRAGPASSTLVLEPAPQGAATLTMNAGGGGIDASTYSSGSFSLTNDGSTQLEQVVIDLSTAWLPGMIFDPVGSAGDDLGKCLVADSGGATVGLLTDGSGSGAASCADPFSGGSAEEGYDVLTLTFDDFDPGESFSFSVDVDPESIQGLGGTGNAGSVSGAELAGSTVTATFDNGAVSAAAFGDGSNAGSVATIDSTVSLPAVGLTVDDVVLDPQADLSAAHQAAEVSATSQVLRVDTDADTDVLLMVGDAVLDDFNRSDRSPYAFEANKLTDLQQFTGTTDGAGTTTFEVTVPQGDGLLYAVAVAVDADGVTGPVSDVIVLEHTPGDPTPDPAILRVNAGGAEYVDSQGWTWDGDTGFSDDTSTIFPGSGPKTGETITGTADPLLYQSERYGGAPEGSPMVATYALPDGFYEVELHFAEIFIGATTGSSGDPTSVSRVFSASAEGVPILSGLNLYEEFGTGVAVTFSEVVEVADGQLDISFVATSDNAKVSAIAVYPAEPPTQGEDLGSGVTVDDDSGDQGATDEQPLVTSVTTPGTGDGYFVSIQRRVTTSTPPAGFELLGQEVVLELSPDAPSAAEPWIVTFELDASILPPGDVAVFRDGVAVQDCIDAGAADPDPCVDGMTTAADGDLQITVRTTQGSVWSFGTAEEPPASGEVLYRVNAGGGQLSAIDGGPAWSADTEGSPSAYLTEGGGETNGFPGGITYDATLPSSTPQAVFDTERWDPPAAPEMLWQFPVEAGTPVEVRLYLMNGFDGTSEPGQRVFDVELDGNLVLDGIDLSGDVGHKTATMRAFETTSDGTIDLQFLHVVENPLVNAIEVVVAGPQPGVLSVTPLALDFGAIATDVTATDTVTLRNLGEAGDPDIQITDVDVTGGVFSTDLTGDEVLAPGAAVTATVTFDPETVGPQAGTLSITHDGTSSSPVEVALEGSAFLPGAAPVSFGASGLAGVSLNNPTSLEFGPDGRLYVSQQNGLLKAYTLERQGSNDYAVVATETIDLIQDIPNHNDDGTDAPGVTTRQVTGLMTAGTAANPALYVSSSDPRIAVGTDSGLDTNSGVLSKLTWNGSSWDHVQLVRGLPRSEENHSTNGLDLDPATGTLYVMSGGHTNKGAPSNNFSGTPEYVYSAAMLAIDLDDLESRAVQTDEAIDYVYNLPTLQDPTGSSQPFGGDNGYNQAILLADSPVQIHSPGYRNAYDVVVTADGEIYTFDNGPNTGWGGLPVGEGPDGVCTNVLNESGSTGYADSLHHVSGPGYYGGHPNPTRANPDSGLFIYEKQGDNSWLAVESYAWSDFTTPPVPASYWENSDVECDYRIPGSESGALATIPSSTNGLAEYTATNFGGAMVGNLLAASFNGNVYRFELNAAGTEVTAQEAIFSGFGSTPLDVTTQGDDGLFPGTAWAVTYGSNAVTVFEPIDYEGGTGDPGDPGDPGDDGDIDGDGILDEDDTFPYDATNGATAIPDTCAADRQVSSPTCLRFNAGDYPDTLLDLGFGGVMKQPGQALDEVYVDGLTSSGQETNIKRGGAIQALSIVEVDDGDAVNTVNTQQNAFMFGVDPTTASEGFTIHSRVTGFPADPVNFQSMGIYLGDGTQDGYVKLVVAAKGGDGGIQFAEEYDASFSEVAHPTVPAVTGSGGGAGPDVDLYLDVDPQTGQITARYAIGDTEAVVGTTTLPAGNDWLEGSGLATGVIATSYQAGQTFSAQWNWFEVSANGLAQDDDGGDGGGGDGGGGDGGADLTAVHRINVGGDPVTAGGLDWSADSYDTTSDGGFYEVGDDTPIAGTDAEAIYRTERWGDPVTYAIPVDAEADYTVRLHFAEIYRGVATNAPAHEVGARVFDISLEGTVVESGYDLAAEASAPLTALVEEYVVTVTDGVLDVSLDATASDNAKLSAIEVLTAVDGSEPTMDPPTAVDDEATTAAEASVNVDVLANDLSDGDLDDSSVAVVTAPTAGEAVVEANGTITYTPDTGTSGTDAFTYTVADTLGQVSNEATVTVTVEAALPTSYRLNAGDVASPVGAAGVQWEPDSSYLVDGQQGSTTSVASATPIDGTDADVLYRTERYGDPFSYALPLADGDYTLRVHLAELYHGVSGNSPTFTTGSRIFDVVAEGAVVVDGLDLFDAIGAPLTAYVIDVPVTVSDSQLDLQFVLGDPGADNAKLSALEVVPGTPDPGTVEVRVNAGGGQVTATDGGPDWAADTGASPNAALTAGGEQTSSTGDAIALHSSVPAGTPLALFQTERYDTDETADDDDEMQWQFQLATGKRYQVRLYMAETFATAAGARSFDINVEGQPAFSGVDLIERFGHDVGAVLTYEFTYADEPLTIDFLRGVENPKINAIEIVDLGTPS